MPCPVPPPRHRCRRSFSAPLSCCFLGRRQELNALQHHAPIEQAKVPLHLKHVPDYIVPKSLQTQPGTIGKARLQLQGGKIAGAGSNGRNRNRRNGGSGGGRRGGKKKHADPLKKFGRR